MASSPALAPSPVLFFRLKKAHIAFVYRSLQLENKNTFEVAIGETSLVTLIWWTYQVVPSVKSVLKVSRQRTNGLDFVICKTKQLDISTHLINLKTVRFILKMNPLSFLVPGFLRLSKIKLADNACIFVRLCDARRDEELPENITKAGLVSAIFLLRVLVISQKHKIF